MESTSLKQHVPSRLGNQISVVIKLVLMYTVSVYAYGLITRTRSL